GLVSFVRPVPFRFILKISFGVSGVLSWLTTKVCWPSGETSAGNPSSAGRVNRFWCVPSVFMTHATKKAMERDGAAALGIGGIEVEYVGIRTDRKDLGQ